MIANANAKISTIKFRSKLVRKVTDPWRRFSGAECGTAFIQGETRRWIRKLQECNACLTVPRRKPKQMTFDECVDSSIALRHENGENW
ncbi:MAG: hypothetical protein AAGH89_19360, partial [Verrucomicrobiota bacterium]